MPNKEAKTIAKMLFEEMILVYGTSKSIRSDLGTEFKNQIFNEVCKLCDIITANHHETVGSIERNHREHT